MAHKCRSSQYSNMRPRYVLGRTIPEAAGIAAAVVLGYIAFQLTSHLTYGGQAGKMHLLVIFAAVALPLVVGFVFFMDGAEPYPRQVVGYLRRRAEATVRRAPHCLRARARGAASGAARPVPHARPSARPAEATDLTGRLIARLRRPRPTVEEAR
jgi:hypothetical protein